MDARPASSFLMSFFFWPREASARMRRGRGARPKKQQVNECRQAGRKREDVRKGPGDTLVGVHEIMYDIRLGMDPAASYPTLVVEVLEVVVEEH
jgi:hypothetical protein